MLLCLLLFIGSSLSVSAQKTLKVSDLKKTDQPLVHDANGLIHKGQIDSLLYTLEEVQKQTSLKVSILLSTSKFSEGMSSEQFAKDLHASWRKDEPNEDRDLILVYNQSSNDFGYYLTGDLPQQAIRPLVEKVQESLLNAEAEERSAERYYDIFNQLANGISSSQISRFGPEGYYSIFLTFFTIMSISWWTRRKGRNVTARYVYWEDANKYLNRQVLFSVPFFIFLYLCIAFLLSAIVELIRVWIFDIEKQPAGDIGISLFAGVIMSFMFLGWLPALFFIQGEKRRLKPMMASREQINREAQYNQSGARGANRQTSERATRNDRQARNAEPREVVEDEGVKININDATVNDIRKLSSLLTIVEVNKIVKDRETNGDYKNLKDLQNRTGLSPSLLDVLKDKITFESSRERHEPRRGRVVDL